MDFEYRTIARDCPSRQNLAVTIIPSSKNRKLGPIPEVYVTASTCPPSCPMFNAGCYGESGLMREHWRNVERHGVEWSELCDFVAALPIGQLWRYAVVGDLPGVGESIDGLALMELIDANHGRKGFTFTHKRNSAVIATSNGLGFTINLSADSLTEADELVALGIGPVVSVVPSDAPIHGNVTPVGRKVVLCPATHTEGVTCASCRMCANPNRKSIIGFPAHGLRKREVSDRARLRVVS